VLPAFRSGGRRPSSPHCFNMEDAASANGFEGQLRHVEPAAGGHRWRRGAGQPWPSASSSWCEIDQDKINLFAAAASSSSTSAASDKCCCGSRIAADIEELEGTTSAAGRSFASGGERMLFRAWDGETRPWSVRELRPHFPDSPGGPDGSGPPGPLTAGRHVTTGKCRTVHKPPSTKPPPIT
jgi:hypothetical protein